MGSTAIARCEPTNPAANASTFLGELYKDGVPAIPGVHTWENKTRYLLNIGDEYLNHVFGWLPMVSDIKALSSSVQNAHRTLSQFERDSGKVVRRQYRFPVEKSQTSPVLVKSNVPLSYAAGFTTALDAATKGQVWKSTKTTKTRWFSGAFTYYLPYDYESRNWIAGVVPDAEKLLGTTLDPELLWNLAPWSWAVDWFANIGDVIHNVSAFGRNGLVLRYGYLMEHSIVEDIYAHIGPSGLYGKDDLKAPEVSLITETKKRVAATPYGFGLNWNGLSSFQTSVLAALGISRVR
jgi:hypothetical protein